MTIDESPSIIDAYISRYVPADMRYSKLHALIE